MSNSTLDLLKLLSSPEELRESIRQMVQEAMNELMKVELDSVLGYQRYGREGESTENCRNGSYHRYFDTEYGPVELNVPRDRKMNSIRLCLMLINDVVLGWRIS